jgi:hypothetical protein
VALMVNCAPVFVVGVPEIVPFELNDSPDGKPPRIKLHVHGQLAPASAVE